MTDIKAKYLGGMVGSALGDAIGKLAFYYPEKQVLCTQLDRSTEFRYTDDSAMSIGLAESILRKGCLYQQDLGETFRYNYQKEPWRGYASGSPTIFSMVQHLDITYTEAARTLFGGEDGAAVQARAVSLVVKLDPKETFPLKVFMRIDTFYGDLEQTNENIIILPLLLVLMQFLCRSTMHYSGH